MLFFSFFFNPTNDRFLFLNLQPTMGQWQIVFFIAAGVYIACATFYNLFGSGVRQPWDNPLNDDVGAIPIRQINGNGVQANGVQHHATVPPSNGQTQLNGNGVRESTQ